MVGYANRLVEFMLLRVYKYKKLKRMHNFENTKNRLMDLIRQFCHEIRMCGKKHHSIRNLYDSRELQKTGNSFGVKSIGFQYFHDGHSSIDLVAIRSTILVILGQNPHLQVGRSNAHGKHK